MSHTKITETHPNWYFDIPVMHILILGSFPPHPSKRDYEFYYPNKINHFWKILSHLAHGHNALKEYKGAAAVEERKQLMVQLKTGVQNIGRIVEREGQSSLDTNIHMREYHDITGIIQKHPELHTILLPGFHAPSSTARSFLNYLQQNGIAHSMPKQVKPGLENSFTLTLAQRSITCHILYSTSPTWKKRYELLLPQFAPFYPNSL